MPRNKFRDKEMIRANRARRAVRPANSRKDASPGSPLRGVLALVGGLLGFAALGYFGDSLRPQIIGVACRVSGCTGPPMAIAGWLLISAPFLWALLCVLLWSRAGRPARWALGAVGVLLGLVTMLFVPGRRTTLRDLVDGTGSEALATGMRWAGLGLVAALVVTFAAAAVCSKLSRTMTAPSVGALAVAAGVAMLAVAIGRAPSEPMTAGDMFPDATFTSAGDTLTMTSSEDRRGCSGVMANQLLLDGCIRTVTAVFTTDDSDAVVRFAAVLFGSETVADQRKADLPQGAGQQGVTGDVAVVSTATQSWLTMATVQHADGRRIAHDIERGYLLWAAKQVFYRWNSGQVGLGVAPSPKPPIAPRTA